MLSLLEQYMLPDADDVGKGIASDFRARRLEKNITRDEIAGKAGISSSNVVRFERSGLISLKNLILLAMALGYTSEIRNIFKSPKYSTMEELTQIRGNAHRKKAHRKK